jgi:6-phosphogluconolactonase (cycloisomerase 2 family)
VLKTIALAADLNSAGGKVHDIALDDTRGRAYVTVRGVAGDDYVVEYSTSTFAEVNRTQVGENPHVVIDGRGGALQVLAENGFVRTFDADALTKLREIAATGAHGGALSTNGKVLYVTNFLSNDGVAALQAFRASDLAPLGAAVNTSFAKPHHMTVTPNGKVYVTHSASNLDKVTVYTIGSDGALTYLRAVTVGVNPQGIVRIPD